MHSEAQCELHNTVSLVVVVVVVVTVRKVTVLFVTVALGSNRRLQKSSEGYVHCVQVIVSARLNSDSRS
jgi:hypothetical protein